MKPFVILGTTFLLWLTLTKRLPKYVELSSKQSLKASNSPTSFDASATPPNHLGGVDASTNAAHIINKDK